MLLNDGCTGVAVLNPSIPFEVQFDEHKMLIVYAEDLHQFENILKQHNIPRNEAIRFLTEAEHIHSTRDEYFQRFHELQTTLGIDEECPVIL
jgi:putative heme degradation protein